MQGILHYCSSLWHVCCGIAKDELFKTFCRRHLGVKVHTTQLFSSDDSGKIITVAHRDETVLLALMTAAIQDCVMVDRYYSACGIIVSPKSARCCNDVFEFNSEFFISNNLYRPSLKWVHAAFSLVETESIFERQEVLSNLLTECLEGGCPLLQNHYTQVAQAILHYRLMGMNVAPLFFCFGMLMSKLPDPSMGFFLMDNPIACGVAGLQYNYWKVIRSNQNLAKRLSHLLTNKDLTTTTSGAPNSAVLIMWGRRKRWERLLEKMEVMLPDWHERIDAYPILLYRSPSNWEEVMTRMMVKVTNPSVAASLNTANCITRVIAASVYMLAKPAMSLSQAWIEMETSGKRYRHSLIGIITGDIMRLQLSPNVQSDELEELLSGLFMHHNSYHEIDAKLAGISINNLSLVYTADRRMMKSELLVYGEVLQPASLERLCNHYWWDKPIGLSDDVADAHFAQYRKNIPWLDKDYKTTLNASPFKSHIQLRNFVARQLHKSRKLRITGAPIAAHASQVHVMALIRHNLWPHWRLHGKDIDDRVHKLSDTKTKLHTLTALAFLPMVDSYKSNNKKTEWATHELNTAHQPWTLEDPQASLKVMKYSIFIATVKAITAWEQTGVERDYISQKDKILRMIKRIKGGMVGGWRNLNPSEIKQRAIPIVVTEGKTKEKAVKYSWQGRCMWVGVVGDCHITLNYNGDDLTSIVTNDIYKLTQLQSVVSSFLKEVGTTMPEKGEELSGLEKTMFLKKLRRDEFVLSSEKGVPIYEMKELKHSYDATTFDPQVKFVGTQLKLINRHAGRNYSILSLNLSYENINYDLAPRSVSQEVYKLLPRAWITGQALTPPQVTTMLQNLSEQSSQYDIPRLRKHLGDAMKLAFVKAGFVSNCDAASASMRTADDDQYAPNEVMDKLLGMEPEDKFKQLGGYSLSEFTQMAQQTAPDSDNDADSEPEALYDTDWLMADKSNWAVANWAEATERAGPSSMEGLNARGFPESMQDQAMMERALENLHFEDVDSRYTYLDSALRSSLKACILEGMRIFESYTNEIHDKVGAAYAADLIRKRYTTATADIAKTLMNIWDGEWEDVSRLKTHTFVDPSVSADSIF
jgi:hypothetical protein